MARFVATLPHQWHQPKITGTRYSSNLDWFRYYEKRFNKSQHPDAAHLAMFYYGCALRDGELDVP